MANKKHTAKGGKKAIKAPKKVRRTESSHAIAPKDRIDAIAEHYRQHRLGYPPALRDWVFETTGVRPPGVIVDLGCGSGNSTRTFARRGFELVGIDPGEEMLELARLEGGGTYRRGESTATGVDSHSTNLVISGMAFHRFDVPATLAELRRILVPGGWCAAFWKLLAKTPLLDQYDALVKSLSSEYENTPKPLPTIATIKARPEVVNVRETEILNRHELDREGLIERAFSSFYVAYGVQDLAGFKRALLDLFERHQVGGRVELLYRYIAIAWQIA
jgi:ubiquinone/menaquinone biosynthesis C-methylase UbiE